MAVVGELLVRLTASTASFASDLGKAKNLSFETSKAMERSFKAIGFAAIGGLTTAATAVSALAIRSINTADSMGKAAKAAGTTTEEFSALAYAAKLSNVPTSALSSSLVILAKNLQKASQATQEGKAAHSALATLFHGSVPQFKSTSDAFIEISKRLDELPKGFQKTALAAQILGKSGALLLPMTEGLQKAIAEAKELGIVISEETAQKAERFNDQITRIKTVVEAFGLRLAEALLPHLERLSDILLEVAKNSGESANKINAAILSVKVLASTVLYTVGAFQYAGHAVGFFISSLDALNELNENLSRDPFHPGDAVDRAAVRIKSSFEELKNAGSTVGKLLDEIWDGPIAKAKVFNETVDVTLRYLQGQKTIMDSISEGLHKPGGALGNQQILSEEDDKRAQSIVASLKEQVGLIGKTAGEAAVYRVELEGGGKALQQQAFHWATLGEAIKAAASAMPKPKDSVFNATSLSAPDILGQLPEFDLTQIGAIRGVDDQLREQARLLNQENRPAIEKYNEEMDKLRLLQEKGGLTTGAFAIEAGKLKEQLKGTAPIAVATRQALDEMFAQAILRSGSFVQALGNVLQRMAELILQVKVLDPLLDKVFNINPATGQSNGSGGGVLGKIFGSIAGAIGGLFGAGNGLDPLGIGKLPIAGYASGGSVSGGVPIMVGERGPEYFVPNVSGRIIPNGGMGAKASFVFNVDARGADAGIEQRVYKVLRDTAPVIVDNAVAKMIDLQRRTA